MEHSCRITPYKCTHRPQPQQPPIGSGVVTRISTRNDSCEYLRKTPQKRNTLKHWPSEVDQTRTSYPQTSKNATFTSQTGNRISQYRGGSTTNTQLTQQREASSHGTPSENQTRSRFSVYPRPARSKSVALFSNVGKPVVDGPVNAPCSTSPCTKYTCCVRRNRSTTNGYRTDKVVTNQRHASKHTSASRSMQPGGARNPVADDMNSSNSKEEVRKAMENIVTQSLLSGASIEQEVERLKLAGFISKDFRIPDKQNVSRQTANESEVYWSKLWNNICPREIVKSEPFSELKQSVQQLVENLIEAVKSSVLYESKVQMSGGKQTDNINNCGSHHLSSSSNEANGEGIAGKTNQYEDMYKQHGLLQEQSVDRTEDRGPHASPRHDIRAGDGSSKESERSQVNRNKNATTCRNNVSDISTSIGADVVLAEDNDDDQMMGETALKEFSSDIVQSLYCAIRNKLEILTQQTKDGCDIFNNGDAEIRDLIIPTVTDHIVWIIEEEFKCLNEPWRSKNMKDDPGKYVDTVATNAVMKVGTDGVNGRQRAKTFIVTSNFQ